VDGISLADQFFTWRGVVAMQTLRATADLVRRIALLALLGFGVVILAGPILAVLSVLLSFAMVILAFALVGFLAWSGFQLLLHGRHVAWNNIQGLGQNLGSHVLTLGRGLGRGLAFIPWLIGMLLAGVFFAVRFVLRMAWATTRFAVEVAFMGLCGVALGAAVGSMGWLPNQDSGLTVPMSAVAGGVIAAGVGAVLALLPKKTTLATR
jgi:hypothetical protein